MSDTDMAQWAHQEECERRRFEEEQEALRADPAYCEWLAYIEAMSSSELKRKEVNYGYHGD